jgi:hypothetical protein
MTHLFVRRGPEHPMIVLAPALEFHRGELGLRNLVVPEQL